MFRNSEKPSGGPPGIRTQARWAMLVSLTVLALLAVTIVVMSAVNGREVTALRVRLVGSAAVPDEPWDKELGAAGRLPDYALRVARFGPDRQLGLHRDTSAADGLTFTLPEPARAGELGELVLVEVDPVLDDELARFQPADGPRVSNGYELTRVTQRSFNAGFWHFAGTPIGNAIMVGIAIAVLLVILALIGPALPSF